MGNENFGKLMSIADASQLLAVKPRTVRAWITTGRLPAFKVGNRLTRVREADVLALIRVRKPSDGGLQRARSQPWVTVERA